jgi:hypothetical protein
MAVLALLAFVAAACGSDRGDDPTESGQGEGDSGGQSQDDSGGEAGTDQFGDLDSPCGPAEEGEEASGGGNEQGVTADQVVIGYGDDAGFPQSPGLNHEMSDAVEAFIAWCNDQGGINGREVVGNYYDAKITEVTNAVTQACGEVFMLVGEGWALDSAVDLWTSAGGALIADQFPDEVEHASVLFGNFSATIDTKDKVVEAFPNLGWNFLDCPQEYNLQGETDWRPFVQQLEDCGVEAVYFVGSAYPNFQNMLDAAGQEGYDPIWLTDPNSYLASFAEWNTDGNGDNVHLRTAFTPFEQADDNPATQQYMDIVEANDGDISQLGQQAASSFLLWATAADACGADLTRDCVMEELSQVTSWTGGGMHAEANPAENEPPDCAMLLKLDGTEWVQAAPEEQGEFACDENYTQPVSGRVVEQAQLNDDRVSTKYGG